jgi:site-specific DNA recombinase
MPQTAIKERSWKLEARKNELTELLRHSKAPPALLHPNMAVVYRQRVAALHASLNHEETKAEAVEILRSLVSEVRLIPGNGELAIHLKGDLAAMLTFAANSRKPPAEPGGFLAQASLVAGAGFEPATFRL